MNSGIVIIGISIIVISVIIYVIKNNQDFSEKYNRMKNNKVFKTLFYILIIFICIFYIRYIYKSIIQIKENVVFFENSKENQEFFEEFDKNLKKEESFYKEAIKKDYGDILKQPYIPDGFEYVEGDVSSGYVIQDQEQNQYVWVPCTNKENDEILKLEKRDFFDLTNLTSIRNYECLDTEYKEFIKSALENGGFYISRFELGKENDKIVSKLGAKVWYNTTRKDAEEIVKNIYTNINCRLINGYAYDTTLAWIKKNNNIEIKNYKDLKNITCGRLKYNNIYDLTDNVMEITLEDLYDTIVYRGYSNIEELSLNNRYNIEDKEINNYDELLDQKLINLLAFRTVIYK